MNLGATSVLHQIFGSIMPAELPNEPSSVNALGSLGKYDTNKDGRLDSNEIEAITLESEKTKSRCVGRRHAFRYLVSPCPNARAALGAPHTRLHVPPTYRSRLYLGVGVGVSALLVVIIAILVAFMYAVVESTKEVYATNGRLVDSNNQVAQVAEAVQTGVPLFWLPAMSPEQVTLTKRLTLDLALWALQTRPLIRGTHVCLCRSTPFFSDYVG